MYYLRALTTHYLTVSDVLSGSLSSELIHYHSLHGSSVQHLSLQAEVLWTSGAVKLLEGSDVQSGSLPAQPAALIELKRVNWVVPAVTRIDDCPPACKR